MTEITHVEKLAEKRGCDLVAEYLIKEKIPYILGYAGHGAIGLLDGIYDRQDKIKLIWPRIEQAAGFMADAYFRLTKVPLPVFASTGPGPANLTIAAGCAYYDSSAFLIMTGEVTTDQFDSGALQEPYRQFPADFPSVMRTYVKQSYQAHTVSDIAKFLPKAYKMMKTGRPGPVHLEVPYDLWVTTEPVPERGPGAWSDSIAWRNATTPEIVDRIIDKLQRAQRPLILAGGGVMVSEAWNELKALAEKLKIPVITSLLGKSAMPQNHPLHLGVQGVWGHYPAVEAARNADVLLAIGCRFNDLHAASWLPGFAYNIPPTELIQIDIDPSEIGRNYPVEIGVVGDAKTVLGQLVNAANQKADGSKGYPTWENEIAGYRNEWNAFVEPFLSSDETPIDPRRMIADIRRISPEDTILFSDVGNNQPWVEQYWDTPKPLTHFTSGGFAAMGFGVCGVLGAKLARPETPIVNVCGDGGFIMMPHAVTTAVEYKLPAVWVIMNNYAIGAIRDLQKFYFDDRQIGTSFKKQESGELWNPDFAAMARSMGGRGYRIEKPGEFGPAFEDALNSGEPAVLDVIINRDIPVPLTTTWQMPPIPAALPTFGKIKVR